MTPAAAKQMEALTALGLDAPAWKAEDLAAMRDNMLNTFDALITRNEN